MTCIDICAEQILIGDDKGNITSWKWQSGLTNTCKLGNAGVISLEFEEKDKLLAVGYDNHLCLMLLFVKIQIIAFLALVFSILPNSIGRPKVLQFSFFRFN